MPASHDRILLLLKTHGPMKAAQLAEALGMTAMGARQHLAALEARGLVAFSVQAEGRGRPRRVWTLTAAGDARFPDRHAEVAAFLIEAVRERLGAAALDQVIAAHESQQLRRYRAGLAGAVGAADAVERLAALRTDEGYMAQAVQLDGGDLLLVENHCPICAAATACQGFCRAELANFQAVLGAYGSVEREEHLLSGARRCAYRLRLAGA
ncbi:MAG: helix-turn-helix transcriptional regulator [Caulobacterales bacterium]